METSPIPPGSSVEPQGLPEPEEGVINFSELAATYQDIRAQISDWRETRAEERVEKLDHKQVLYSHLGNLALNKTSTITEADGSTPQPQSWAERFIDKRLEKLSFKQAVKQSQRKFTVSAFGGEASNTLSSGARLSTIYRRHTVNSAYRDGALSARERREARTRINARPFSFENPEQRRTREAVRSAEYKTKRSARQPILSRWRQHSIDRGMDAAIKHSIRADKHRDKRDDLRAP